TVEENSADPGLPVVPWVLSGGTERALQDQAARLRAHLETCPDLRPVDVGFSLATTRSHFEHRAVAVGEDRAELLRGLDVLADGEPGAGVVRGAARSAGALA
uniref:CurL C-terminal domain-containing protein n=1 Tax=Allosalinactinospora lopnorensis TaxID=1352348 RepID=UPI000623EEF9